RPDPRQDRHFHQSPLQHRASRRPHSRTGTWRHHRKWLPFPTHGVGRSLRRVIQSSSRSLSLEYKKMTHAEFSKTHFAPQNAFLKIPHVSSFTQTTKTNYSMTLRAVDGQKHHHAEQYRAI